MHVTFWGVRGSHPVPGPSTVKYGGHTACVEISAGDHRLIIDAGTGLRPLGQALARNGEVAGTHHILISHVHWDHIQGLPFFAPMASAGAEISIYGLPVAAATLRDVLGGVLRPELWPPDVKTPRAALSFVELSPGERRVIGGFQVLPFALNHPFGALGYRIDCNAGSLAYVSDTGPFSDVLHKRHFLAAPEPLTTGDRDTLDTMRADVVAAIEGVDTVIHDTHFLPDEYARYPHFGHSTPDHALALCRDAGVRRLILYHHAPSHTDDIMDGVEADYRFRGSSLGIDVEVARERSTFIAQDGAGGASHPVDGGASHPVDGGASHLSEGASHLWKSGDVP